MTTRERTITLIASICHDANRRYCIGIGDHSQPVWGDAEDWQKESAIKGVEFRLANPGATPKNQHKAWMKDKLADGWKFGTVKSPELKLHPCLVEYDDLPEEQKAKDALFGVIVNALKPLLHEAEEPETCIAQTKRWRKQLDEVLQEMKAYQPDGMTVERGEYEEFLSREQATMRLIESIMWCGKIEEALGALRPVKL